MSCDSAHTCYYTRGQVLTHLSIKQLAAILFEAGSDTRCVALDDEKHGPCDVRRPPYWLRGCNAPSEAKDLGEISRGSPQRGRQMQVG